jgi:hypothetical protein
MTDTITEFPKRTGSHVAPMQDTAVRLSGTEPGTTTGDVGSVEFRVQGSQALAPIAIDQLYPRIEGVKQTDVINALTLLADAITRLEQARTAFNSENGISADRHLQRFQLMLPDLFSYRRIGDGYAAIINSLHFAFVNLRGQLLNFEQITTIWRVLKEIRTRPFLTLEEGLEYVDQLEQSKLEVDAPILSELLAEDDE